MNKIAKLEKDKMTLANHIKDDEKRIKKISATALDPKDITRCASKEGEICRCSGIVYYGEKYDRTDALVPETDKKELTFSEMKNNPYLTKDMSHGGLMI
jgi:hypothetical protein